jgi:DNA-binding CsgD family transcriptional regulator
LLQELYGLTPREADVANKLCEGKTVEQVADDLEMQYETARTHLRRILSKTGTSRQAEMIILLAKLPRQTL